MGDITTRGKDAAKPMNGLDLAYKIIILSKGEKGLVNNLSPLKLQKILFYAQGWYAGNTHARLFSDDIYAWQYGPVVEEVYHHFKPRGSEDLKAIKDLAFPDETGETIPQVDDYLKPLLGVYGKMSPYELVARTHQDELWKRYYQASNKVIPFEDIKTSFIRRVAAAR